MTEYSKLPRRIIFLTGLAISRYILAAVYVWFMAPHLVDVVMLKHAGVISNEQTFAIILSFAISSVAIGYYAFLYETKHDKELEQIHQKFRDELNERTLP